MKFVPVESMDEVLATALFPKGKAAEPSCEGKNAVVAPTPSTPTTPATPTT
jgi:hypothetical protein